MWKLYNFLNRLTKNKIIHTSFCLFTLISEFVEFVAMTTASSAFCEFEYEQPFLSVNIFTVMNQSLQQQNKCPSLDKVYSFGRTVQFSFIWSWLAEFYPSSLSKYWNKLHIFFVLLERPNLFAMCNSANGGNGEGWHVEEYSVALQNESEIQFVPHRNHIR
jgi:hypothetical protein